MRLGVLTEPEGENRVAIVPNSVKKLTKKGLEVFVESGAGVNSNFSDNEYESAGANISQRDEVLSCELLITIRMLDSSELRSCLLYTSDAADE